MKDGTVNVLQRTEAETENSNQSDHDNFDFSQDFGLWETGDDRAFPFQLGHGQGLTGYISAEDDVSAHFLTRRNMNLFSEGEGFATEWHTEQGTYLQINFFPEKPGVYHLLVTNADDLENYESSDDHDYDEEDKFEVRVRLNSSRRKSALN